MRRSNRTKSLLGVLLVAMDVLMLGMAFIMGYAGRLYLPFLAQPESLPPLVAYVPTLILHILMGMGLFYFSRLYHQRRVFSRFDHARDIFGSVTVSSVMAWSLQELLFRGTILEVDYPRGMFVYAWFFSAVMVLMGREAHRILKWSVRRRGVARDNLLIVGTGRVAREITHKIQNSPHLGYNIVGVVNDHVKPKGHMLGIPVIGL
ncbi:hypothetical protein HC928_20935, partial [bacterium]|nr:hypothetical protein [bacterium]